MIHKTCKHLDRKLILDGPGGGYSEYFCKKRGVRDKVFDCPTCSEWTNNKGTFQENVKDHLTSLGF